MGCVSITFDEGRLSQYKYAFPILKEYNYQATVYLITKFIGKNWQEQNVRTKILNYQQIKDLKNAGWEVASHTHTHCSLVLSSVKTIKKDLLSSVNTLKSIGVNRSGLAYPGGYAGIPTYKYISECFSYGRGIVDKRRIDWSIISLNNKSKINKFDLTSNCINQGSFDIKIFEENIRSLKKDEWSILVFHEIAKNVKNYDDSISIKNFEEILKVIKKHNVDIKKVEEIVKMFVNNNKINRQFFMSSKEYVKKQFGNKYLTPLLILYSRVPLIKRIYTLLPDMHNYFNKKEIIENDNYKNKLINYYDKHYSEERLSGIENWRRSYFKRIFNLLHTDKFYDKRKTQKHFLDIGVGAEGYTVIEFAKKGFKSYGVDVSPGGIEKSKCLSKKHLDGKLQKNSNFIVASAEKLPFPNRYFDDICLISVLEYVEDDHLAIDEIARVIKPGGRLIITATNERPFILKLNEYIIDRKKTPKLRFYKANNFTEYFYNRGFKLIDLTYHGHYPKIIQAILMKIFPSMNNPNSKTWWLLEEKDLKMKNNPLSLLFTVTFEKL